MKSRIEAIGVLNHNIICINEQPIEFIDLKEKILQN